jgi:dTDP-4-dehydro-6-deoxy-alpha-D-glucopyranose 2,3-dehydratase
MADQENIGWLRDRLQASLAIEPRDPAELVDWLEARRKDVPFSAELIALRDVAGWHQADNGNISSATGQFFRIEGVRVKSVPGLREIAGWDQPILTQSEGGVLALLCRETPRQGVEFLLQAKADPGNIGYLQFCPTIQSTWENIRGLKGARPAPFAECLDPSENIRVIYKSKHNEEGSRFWQKSNENMILFIADASRLAINEQVYRWASLSQIKAMALLDNVVGPYVRTVVAPL